MFALGIRYLNGWSMATDWADRNCPEWPPHPDRVFMALAAAFFESDGARYERAALEWLESQPPPAIRAANASFREPVTSFVPVNDSSTSKMNVIARLGPAANRTKWQDAGLALLPEFRSRQPRTFPVAIPEPDERDEHRLPHVFLIWPMEAPPEIADAFGVLCERVTHVGHSATFVQMWVEGSPPDPNMMPTSEVATTVRLRAPFPGRLASLEQAFNADDVNAYHQMSAAATQSRDKEQTQRKRDLIKRFPDGAPVSMRPVPGRWQAYGSPTGREVHAEPPPGAVFDPNLLILVRTLGVQVGLESTVQITDALRGTLMSHAALQPPPEWLSGHVADGAPSQAPHIALLPLPHVGHPQATGGLLGVAIALPRAIAGADRASLGKALYQSTGAPSPIELRTAIGVWHIEVVDQDQRKALQPVTWTAAPEGCERWGTVTPIAFDRHPKETWSDKDPPRIAAEKRARYWTEVEEMIAKACENIGLPRPVEVIATPTSMFVGAPSSARMPRLARKDGGERRQTHAVIRFDRPVVGPVLLGAGRYRGAGFCRPIRGGDHE